MKLFCRLLCVFTCFIINITVLKGQSLKTLEEINGFKKYKLGSRFVLGTGIKTKNEAGGDKVVIDYTTEKIGDIPVKSIELFYLRDTLSRIVVRVLPEFYKNLLEALTNSFGEATENKSSYASSGNDYYIDRFFWNTKKFNLEYYYFHPTVSGGGYGTTDLHLAYTLNDYNTRQQRTKAGNYSAKDF